MNSGIFTPLIGRFGNKLFQWAHAKAVADRDGLELVTPDWEGQEIFQIERTRKKHREDLLLGGYAQNQDSLIYTRAQCREWFKFRPWVQDLVWSITLPSKFAVGHRRVGDYAGSGMVVCSQGSYDRAFAKFCPGQSDLLMVTEENPAQHPAFTGNLAFVPDFLQLMYASTLFRGNSTFSWWAATLGHGQVFSPVVAGLVGGQEHDVEFVEGNWPRFCDLPNITDLHLQES